MAIVSELEPEPGLFEMYYVAKALELLGIFIAVGFIIKYPGLMDPKLLLSEYVLALAG